jgi:hypothetical protein
MMMTSINSEKLSKLVEKCQKKHPRPSKEGEYWSDRGKYSLLTDIIQDHLIPNQGESDFTWAECYRKLAKLYYDMYNNGGGNILDGCYTDYIDDVARHCKSIHPPLTREQKTALYDIQKFADDDDDDTNSDSEYDDHYDHKNYLEYIGSLDTLIDAVIEDLVSKWTAFLQKQEASVLTQQRA